MPTNQGPSPLITSQLFTQWDAQPLCFSNHREKIRPKREGLNPQVSLPKLILQNQESEMAQLLRLDLMIFGAVEKGNEEPWIHHPMKSMKIPISYNLQ